MTVGDAMGVQLDKAFVEHECVAVVCTGCGQHFGDDFTYHFASRTEALRLVIAEEWTVTDDAVLCIDCGDNRPPAPSATAVCEYCAPPLFPDTALPDRCRCVSIKSVHVPFISLRHRGFERHSCVTIACTQCGEGLGGDDAEPHYPSQAAAIKGAKRRDWMVTDRVVCRDCAQRLACVTLGHDFPEIVDYTIDDIIEVRWCRRCGEPVKNLVGDEDMPWL